jgi:hypothetical protein
MFNQEPAILLPDVLFNQDLVLSNSHVFAKR